jgi:hypothetical protein
MEIDKAFFSTRTSRWTTSISPYPRVRTGKNINCVFSYNMDNLIFRLRLNSNVFNKTKKRGGVAGSDRRDLSVEEFSGHVAKQYRIARRVGHFKRVRQSRTP